jgi:hypothetical protein
MSDHGLFRIGDRVVIGGSTVHRGEAGVVRGCRRAGGEERQYFVYYNKKWWPLEPQNGMWVLESRLTHVVPDTVAALIGDDNG